MQRLTTLSFKAGDTFHFAGELAYAALDPEVTWGLRASIRDLSGKTRPPALIDTLTCVVYAPPTEDDAWGIGMFRGATFTDNWPRPTDNKKPYELICDLEFYDTSDDNTVVSASSFIIEIEFDPTRPGDA